MAAQDLPASMARHTKKKTVPQAAAETACRFDILYLSRLIANRVRVLNLFG